MIDPPCLTPRPRRAHCPFMFPTVLRRDRVRWGVSLGEAGWRLGLGGEPNGWPDAR